jgi:hypothetical protein
LSKPTIIVGSVAAVLVVQAIGSASANALPKAPVTYFRMTTSVVVDKDEALDIDVVVKCGWTVRQPFGSAPS